MKDCKEDRVPWQLEFYSQFERLHTVETNDSLLAIKQQAISAQKHGTTSVFYITNG